MAQNDIEKNSPKVVRLSKKAGEALAAEWAAFGVTPENAADYGINREDLPEPEDHREIVPAQQEYSALQLFTALAGERELPGVHPITLADTEIMLMFGVNPLHREIRIGVRIIDLSIARNKNQDDPITAEGVETITMSLNEDPAEAQKETLAAIKEIVSKLTLSAEPYLSDADIESSEMQDMSADGNLDDFLNEIGAERPSWAPNGKSKMTPEERKARMIPLADYVAAEAEIGAKDFFQYIRAESAVPEQPEPTSSPALSSGGSDAKTRLLAAYAAQLAASKNSETPD